MTTRCQNVENRLPNMFLKLLTNLIKLKIGAADFSTSLGPEFDKIFLDSLHVSNMKFKPSWKNPDFGFLPLPSKPVWLKNDHLNGLKLLNCGHLLCLERNAIHSDTASQGGLCTEKLR